MKDFIINILMTGIVLFFMIVITGFTSMSHISEDISVVYNSPRPQSQYNSTGASVLFKINRLLSENDVLNFRVEIIENYETIKTGDVVLAGDNKTLVFKPHTRFTEGAIVNARLIYNTSSDMVNQLVLADFEFCISKCISAIDTQVDSEDYSLKTQDNGYNKFDNARSALADDYRSEYNLPVNFPAIIISYKNKPDYGNYFLSSRYFGAPGSGTNYMICVDTCGTPIFYKTMDNRGSDFRMQPNGYLTHYAGEYSYYTQYDSSYNEMRSYRAPNGYLTDLHELLIEDDGSYWLFTKELHVIDMSMLVAGGNPEATVEENIIQHLDYNGNLLFQWNSLDHIPITDCDPNFVNLTGSYIDYIHVNALDFDVDGHLLLSSRHLNEITKINVNTGNIIWRWGGSENQFTFINDENGFYGQHSIRSHGSGRYSLFDNGNWHFPRRSRGLEYVLDELNMTATLINEFTTGDGNSYSGAMGHMQRTEDNGTLIGWAANTQGFVLTDYNQVGEKVLDIMNIDTNLISYRAYKYPWETNAFYFLVDTIEFHEGVYVGDSVTTTALLYNNSNDMLEISGFHTNNEAFAISDDLPILIPQGMEKEITVVFKPQNEAFYTDALTLYSDQKNDSVRIATQARLIGGLITSTEENKYSQLNVILYPNPVTENTIISTSENEIIKNIRIYDLSGKIVFNRTGIYSHTYQPRLYSLENSIYVIEIETINQLYTKKILIR
jgi:arylsulfotransferase ASST/type IX secretion system substrate protein